MRWTLRIVVGLALLIAIIFIVAAVHLEWTYRSAARKGAAQLAQELALPPLANQPAVADTTPVLILLHGAGLNGQMWNAVRRHLDPKYRVIALDLPGHGIHRDSLYTPDAAVAEVLAAVRSVTPAPVVLIGDSLGGYTAMAAASAVPKPQLAGLVLAGSSGTIDASAMPGSIAQSLFVRGLLLFNDENALSSKALGLFGVGASDAPALIAAGVNLNAVVPSVRSLVGIDFRAKLAAVDVPVLIINGSLDKGSIEHEASFVAAAKHATSLRFENCEHGVSMRRPAEFAAAVNTFAARLPPTKLANP